MTTRRLACFLTLSLFLAACQFPPLVLNPDRPTTPTPDPLSSGWDDRSIFRAGLIVSAQPVLDRLSGASVYHLELEIDDDLYHVSGTEEVRYTNNEDVALSQVELRLFPNILGGEMDISKVQVDGQDVAPERSLEDSLLAIPLAPALEPGKSATLRIDFSVRVPQSLDLNYGVLAFAEGVLALAHAYPIIAVYDDEGWNAEIPPQSGDMTYADMSFFIVRVTAPKDLTLVATGREIGRTETSQAQVVTYASGPARDFYLAASPEYEVFNKQIGDLTIRFYAPGSLQAGAEAGLDMAARAVEDYSARYAPYPYTELDLVSTPTQALGIEYPGMIAITRRIIDPQEPFLEGTIAHEVGHQWFYNLVGNDQLDDPWLDESLAQFATLQYFTDEYGESGAQGFRTSLTGRWERADGELIPIGLPVAAYSGQEYGAVVYGRGPLFFEALKEKMGARAFDAFLKEYVMEHAWGIATPAGLKQVAEAECSCDLTPLFQNWVYP